MTNIFHETERNQSTVMKKWWFVCKYNVTDLIHMHLIRIFAFEVLSYKDIKQMNKVYLMICEMLQLTIIQC